MRLTPALYAITVSVSGRFVGAGRVSRREFLPPAGEQRKFGQLWPLLVLLWR